MESDDLGNLAKFMSVAQEASFTRAAAKLGVSQSALSHCVRRLEEKLGLRLLTRTTRSVAPTEAGESLLETLRPAFAAIEDKLAILTAMRDKPAGTVRITCSAHAARLVLWPTINRIMHEHPDIHIELNVDSGFADIVSGRFDAGVRLGESLDKDMIAVRIGPRLRMAAYASPAYLAARGLPRTPHDLHKHACINLRLTTSGALYAWEFEQNGRDIRVKVEGHLVVNDMDLMVEAALAGHGIGFSIENHVEHHLASGALVRVLDDWCEPFDGLYLYYPSARQPTMAFRLLLDALRYRD
ncbi:LysR family transcriptional regulator [Novosphingobium sp. FSY-8]|uniref:LysR family transcriptional regulator n=1 Tax=Novosphingobium ovatum TaxID=1908523 RepID=A0ABW9X9C7_9SPHN|nr:LysR family transcriptional regulator [Novosphingobium ovatum]NBC35117.1 LysR family transcriptional regulator [Novosphingobium ovatum]